MRRQDRLLEIGGDEGRRLTGHLGPRALDPEGRGNLRVIGRDDHPHAVALLDLAQPVALVVQQIQRDRGRDMHDDLGRTALAAFLLDPAQDMDRRTFRAADMAGAAAMRTGDEAGFRQGRAQALPAHFQQAEMADAADLDARAVVAQRVLQAAFHHRVVPARLHVNEVDDDQPGQVPQAQLARDLIGRLQVRAQRGFLDVAFPSRTARVHVDRDQRFRLVDHQIPTRAQLHRRAKHRVELRLHLIAGEQRLRLVTPELHLARMGRHEHPHELMRRAPAVDAIDLDLIDVASIDVADGPFDETRFLIDHRRRDGFHRVVADVIPHSQQILAVALDLRLGARRPGGADDQAHAAGDVQFGHHLLQAAAIGGGGDLAGNPAPARRVRHQHAEPAGEREVGGQGRALGAALFLDDLHQHDLAAADDFLNFVAAQEAGWRPAFAGFIDAVGITAQGFRRRAFVLVAVRSVGISVAVVLAIGHVLAVVLATAGVVLGIAVLIIRLGAGGLRRDHIKSRPSGEGPGFGVG